MTKGVMLPFMNLLRVQSMPILKQLLLEERLLRTSSSNWCIINSGSNPPTIVMGCSGKPDDLLDVKSVLRDEVSVVRRFSGGGTVIVDQGTIFVTFICNKDAVPGLQPYPHPIMSWTHHLYSEVLEGTGNFCLRENDYAFGDLKFGGNAQSLTKTRWLHHTSFLWDYDSNNMAYLKIPTCAPGYRLARSHDKFLCKLKSYLPDCCTFMNNVVKALGNRFLLQKDSLSAIECSASTPFSTRCLDKTELEKAVSVDLYALPSVGSMKAQEWEEQHGNVASS